MANTTDTRPAPHPLVARLRALWRSEDGSGIVGATVFMVLVGLIGASSAGLMAVSLGNQRDNMHRTMISEGLSEHSDNARLSMLAGDTPPEGSVSLSEEVGDRSGTRVSRYSVTHPDTFMGFDDTGEAVWVNKEGAEDHHFSQLVTGEDFSCGLEVLDATVWCWGSNAYGQLGDGTLREASEPVRVVNADGEAQVFEHLLQPTGYGMCATRTEQGYLYLYCWGKNTDGRFQVPNSAGEITESLVHPFLVDARGPRFDIDERADRYAMGPNTMCFTRFAGSPSKDYSDGRQLNCRGRMAIAGSVATATSGIKHVTADAHTVLAIDHADRVLAVTDSGLGALGRLPDASTPDLRGQRAGLPYEATGQRDTLQGVRSPLEVPIGSSSEKVLSVHLTQSTSETEATTAYAVMSTGRVYFWGDNSDGEAGGLPASGESRFLDEPRVRAGSYQGVSITGSRTVLHRKDGGVELLGRKIDGFHTGKDVVAVETSRTSGPENTVCLTLAGGDVLCGGDNRKHQTGDDKATSAMRAVRGLGKKQVSLGADFGCALDVNDVASCWGYSGLGQTGRGLMGQEHRIGRIAARDVPVGSLTRIVDGQAVAENTMVKGGN